MALLVHVLHRFEGDGTTAFEGEVAAAFQVGALVELVTFTGEGEVTAGDDAGADITDISHFVALGLLGAEGPFFFMS